MQIESLHFISCLYTTIVVLAVFVGVEIILGLGHSVPTGGALVPALLGVGPTLCIKRGIVLENSGFLCVSIIVSFLLLLFCSTNFLVLGLRHTRWDVRVLRERPDLNLFYL